MEPNTPDTSDLAEGAVNNTKEPTYLEKLVSVGLQRCCFPPAANPMVIWARKYKTPWDYQPPQAVVHVGVVCDGPLCTEVRPLRHAIRGPRFHCLDCKDLDFCANCITCPENKHDPAHEILKFETEFQRLPEIPEKCQVCHNLDLPWAPSDIWNASAKEYEIKVSIFEQVAVDQTCEHCAMLWRALLLYPPPAGWPPKENSVKIRFRITASNCMEYAVVSEPKTTETEFTVGSETYIQTSRPTGNDEYRLELIGRLDYAQDLWERPRGRRGPIRLVHPNSGSEESLTLARTWLQSCVEKHEICSNNANVSLPSRLIDLKGVDPTRVYLRNNSGVNGPYVALSYCWGQDLKSAETTLENISTHSEAGLLVQDLPTTIKDAIRVATSLNIRYIWIDRLCIIQNDTDDWTREAANMCDVYANAFLTISADRSDDAQSGLFGTQKYSQTGHSLFLPGEHLGRRGRHKGLADQDISKTEPRHRRAWTLQEDLVSKRILHFTSNELIWECNTVCECECGRDSRLSDRRFNKTSHSDVQDVYIEWTQVVQQYTTRSLRNATDKFPAISGLATRTRQLIREFSSEDDVYLAGLWKNDLATALAWQTPSTTSWDTWLRNNEGPTTKVDLPREESDENDLDAKQAMSAMRARYKTPKNRRSKQYIAPTWSWASMIGPIEYFFTLPRSSSRSYVDVVSSNMKSANLLDPQGKLCEGSNIVLCGYMAGGYKDPRLQLAGFQGIFDTDDPKMRTLSEITFLTFKDEEVNVMIEFEADDPVDTIKRLKGEWSVNAVCLLLGTRAITPSNSPGPGSRSLAIIGMQPKTRLSRGRSRAGESCDVGQSSTISSGSPNEDVLVVLEESNAGNSTSDCLTTKFQEEGTGGIGQSLHQIFNFHDAQYNNEDETVLESFYVVLIPSETYDRDGGWERVGSFHIGLGDEDRAIMEDIFRFGGRRDQIRLL